MADAADMNPAVEPLFRPISLHGMDLPNRLVMAPMTRGFASSGVPGAEVARYYRRRAEGGVGLVVTEGVIVDHPAAQGVSSQGQDLPVLHGDRAIAGWRRVVDEVQAAGARIIPQLWHYGVMRLPGTGPVPDARPCRPSGTWGPTDRPSAIPLERRLQLAVPTAQMSENDIAEVIAAYARSAANAVTAGFDGIALHGAHGYLIDSFLWAETNQRDDRWGGDIARRTSFGVEVVRAIRTAIGPFLPIVFRFSQWKQQDFEGRIADTPAELEQILGPLGDAGVDVFDASTRIYSRPAFAGSALSLAGWAKKVTGRPTIAVGGIGLSQDLYASFGTDRTATAANIEDVASRVDAGEFDLIAVGRSLLADPTWPQTVRAGLPLKPFERRILSRLE